MDQFNPFDEGDFNNFFDSADPFSVFQSQNQNTGNTSNAFSDIGEFEPDIPFFGAQERANLTPNQAEFFKTRRNEVFNRFQSVLDQQIRSGQAPTARFTDFVNDFDFDREFNQSGAAQRFASPQPLVNVFQR